MKLFILAAVFLSAFAHNAMAGSKYYIACQGENFRVIIEQWESTLQLKHPSGAYQSLHLMVSQRADFVPGRSVTYDVAEANYDFSVVRYVLPKTNTRASSTAVDIKSRNGNRTYEAKVACAAKLY
jgi:hypothetical protein